MLLNAAQGQPAIPFWLQVLTIALAPVIGFAGVAVGALMKNRSDRKAALMSERRKVYASYAQALTDLSVFMGTKATTALRTEDEDRLRAVMQALPERLGAVEGLRHQIDLLAGAKVATAARHGLMFGHAVSASILRCLTKGFSREEMASVTSLGTRAIEEFRDAALKEMGVPRRERKREKSKTVPFEELQRQMRQQGFDFDSPPTVKEAGAT